MEKVEQSKKDKLYKAEVIFLKVLPFALAFLVLLSTILDYFMVNSTIVGYVMFMCIFAFLYISSYVFKFCAYHRMPLHYIILVNALSVYDIYYTLPLNVYQLFLLYAIITCLFIFLTVYLYVKNHKKPPSKNNR